MAKRRFAFQCEGPLVRRAMHQPGAKRELFYVVLFLSDAVERRLTFGKNGRLRIEGELDGVPVKLALQPSPGENHYVMVGKTLLEKTGALLGDTVTLSFDIADPDEVDVPAELLAALRASPAVEKKWRALTPGKQRTWSVYVDRAKRAETREAKAREVVDRVKRNLLGQRDRWP